MIILQRNESVKNMKIHKYKISSLEIYTRQRDNRHVFENTLNKNIF